MKPPTQTELFPSLTLSSEASRDRAKTSPSPAKAQDSTASDQGFGLSTPGLWASLDPVGYLLRTSALSVLEGWTGFVLTWRAKDTPSGRFWWVLGRSERRTDESESGSWPTATSQDQVASGPACYSTESGRHSGTTLTDAANGLWATPQAQDSKQNVDRPCSAQVMLIQQCRSFPSPKASDGRSKGTGGTADHGLDAMARAGLLDQGSRSTSGRSRDWPTARGFDHHGPQRSGTHNDPNLPAAVQSVENGLDLMDWDRSAGAAQAANEADGTATLKPIRGVLNSRWVAQLMGYPSDWLDVPTESLSKLWATRSSRKSSMPSGGRSSRSRLR